MANPQGDFIWYELMTPDPAGAKDFYDAVIGWTMEAAGNAMPNGSEYREILRPDGKHAGGVLTLTKDMCDAGMKPGWIGYIHAADIEASTAHLAQMGGQIFMPVSDMPGIGKMAMVADPQGAAFYLMQPTPPAGQPDASSDVFSENEPYRCGWNELGCGDPDDALGFYAKLLGWDSPETMDMGQFGKYHFLNNGALRLGAIYQSPDGPARWRYYFRVPDIEAAQRNIAANGGTITQGLHQVPGDDWIVMAEDPQGAGFAVVGKKAVSGS